MHVLVPKLMNSVHAEANHGNFQNKGLLPQSAVQLAFVKIAN
jgi:hypothetical protein